MTPGITDPTTMESIACPEALTLASDLNLPKVLIATDCKQLADDIKTASGGLHGVIVKEIVTSMSAFESCSIVYESRDSNLEARSLAKLALGLDAGHHVWLLQTPDLNWIPMDISINE